MAQGEKCPNADIFGPNTGEYGPEKTPHLDTFYAMWLKMNLLRKSLIYYQQIRIKFLKKCDKHDNTL